MYSYNLKAQSFRKLLTVITLCGKQYKIELFKPFYIMILFSQVGIALIGTCVVLKYHFNNPAIHKMPDWLRFVVLRCLGKIFHKQLRDDENPLETGSPFEKRKRLRTDNGYIETLLPRNELLNQKFNSIERRLSGMASGRWPMDGRARGGSEERENRGSFLENDTPEGFDDKSYLTRAITYKQGTIANALEKLVEAKEAEDEEGKQREEWMMAASIMDSLFMWIFFLTLLGSLAALFLQIPKYD